VPFVLMNRSSGDFPVVRADDAMGGYLATRHLIGLGHRRIALVAGQLDVSTAALRLEGYRLAHTEAGMTVDERLVVPCDFSALGGIRAGGQVLSMPDRPTGIVAVNDWAAVGVMSVARDLGFRIPDDLSVIGYNDDQLASLLPVPLSSIHLPLEQIGRGTVDLLVAQLRGETPESVVQAPSLVARSSTGHPPSQ
jgi:LacI family transcriptional regulator